MIDLIGNAVLYFIIISIVMIPLERAFLLDKKPILRHEFILDSIFYFGQAVLWNSITLIILNQLFSNWEWSYLQSFRNLVNAQPVWIQGIEVIFLCDLFIYWGHRLQHKYNFLWKFHRVHHTAETVDFIAAFREHPLDNIYTRGIETFPAILFGFDLNLIVGFVTFRGLWAMFIHSNVDIRLGFLEIIFGSPHLHHWHHELEKGGNYNYANLSPIMDLIFGTYYSPIQPAKNYGIKEPFYRSYPGQMIEPFVSMFIHE